MENLMQENPLPQTSKNFLIYSHGDAVFAKTSVGSAIQLHLVAEDLKITSRQSNSSCEIEASDLSGCYNCMAGAELTLSCRSSHGQVTANILCPTQTQIAHCTKTGHLNKLKFHFSNPTVLTECIVSCPGGSTVMKVKGSLQFVDDGFLKSDIQADATVKEVERDTSFFDRTYELP
ncbi:hypothetical protein OSTOST_02788 [Ostertagia ostertagi]